MAGPDQFSSLGKARQGLVHCGAILAATGVPLRRPRRILKNLFSQAPHGHVSCQKIYAVFSFQPRTATACKRCAGDGKLLIK